MTTLLQEPPVLADPAPPRRPRPVALVVAGLVLLVLAGLLVGLLTRPGASGGDRATVAALPAEPGPPAGAAQVETGRAVAGAGAGAAAEPGTEPGTEPRTQGRVVKSGTVALAAPQGRVGAVLDAVQRVAVAQGGEVFGTSTEEQGDRPTGSVVVRVPAARFEDLVLRVRGLAPVRSASTSGTDVTAQTADVEAQVESLQAVRGRFLAILGRARTVAEVLSVQQQVDDVAGRIDALQSQARVLRASSDFSTLTVDVAQADDPYLPASSPRSGFSGALADAWDGFTSGAQALVRRSGRALLVLMCLAPLLALAGGVRRRVRRSAA